MYLTVQAIRPPDERWKQMKAVYDACRQAKLPVPDEVYDFFGDEPPDDAGVVQNLKVSSSGDKNKWVSGIVDYSAEMSTGVEITLADLPPNTPKLRIYMSW